MAWYWLLLLVPAWYALAVASPGAPRQSGHRGAWLAMGATLVLIVGLRYEVGGDWFNYKENLTRLYELEFSDALRTGDPAFSLLGWWSQQMGGDQFVNVICASAFSIGLLSFCRAQPQPWLTLAIAIPYLVIVVAMGYTRQGVAIGLVMAGIVALQRGHLSRFLMWIVVAALFHKSAVILIGFALFSRSQIGWMTLLGGACVGALAFVVLLQESLDVWFRGYLVDQMESSGAAIRVGMNALPAAVFLLLRRRFNLPPAQRRFWTWMAVSALLFLPLLAVSPSSTAVDRIALYWIPIQLFVLGRLPIALSSKQQSIRIYTGAVLMYCAAVQFAWLFFATHSYAWLPYRFYPLEWLRGVL